MRKMILALSAASLTVPAVALPDAAMARGVGTYHGQTWRGSDGRVYCRKPSGTTGLIIGGAVGALLGNAIDNGRSSILGTIIGALIISVLTNGLRILSVAQEWQTVVTGVIIILAVYADILRRRG